MDNVKTYAAREWRPLGEMEPPLNVTVEFKTTDGFTMKGQRISEEGYYVMEHQVPHSTHWRFLPFTKKPIRVIVSMFGGVIQGVLVDPRLAFELDVVVLEGREYGSGDEAEVEVESGEFEGDIVYSHVESEVASKEDLDAVFAAAAKRKAVKFDTLETLGTVGLHGQPGSGPASSPTSTPGS